MPGTITSFGYQSISKPLKYRNNKRAASTKIAFLYRLNLAFQQVLNEGYLLLGLVALSDLDDSASCLYLLDK